MELEPTPIKMSHLDPNDLEIGPLQLEADQDKASKLRRPSRVWNYELHYNFSFFHDGHGSMEIEITLIKISHLDPSNSELGPVELETPPMKMDHLR